MDFLVFLFSPEFFVYLVFFVSSLLPLDFTSPSHWCGTDATASWRSSLSVISVLHGVQSASLLAYPQPPTTAATTKVTTSLQTLNYIFAAACHGPTYM